MVGVGPMDELKRIRRVSAVMKGVCTAGIAAIPIAVSVFWALVTPEALRAYPGVNYDIAALPPATRMLAFLLTMIPGLISLYGLLALRRLFDAYRRGALFAAGNALCLRTFAFSIVVATVAKMLMIPVMSVVLSWHNPPGNRALSIAINSDDLGALFAGFLFLVVAWIMAEAQRIAEDNAQIV